MWWNRKSEKWQKELTQEADISFKVRYSVTLWDTFRCNASAEAASNSVLTLEEDQMMSEGKMTNIWTPKIRVS